jgi:hypothetical protein
VRIAIGHKAIYAANCRKISKMHSSGLSDSRSTGQAVMAHIDPGRNISLNRAGISEAGWFQGDRCRYQIGNFSAIACLASADG